MAVKAVRGSMEISSSQKSGLIFVGAFVIAGGEIAGSLSVSIVAAAGTDFSFEGRFVLELNSSEAPVTIETAISSEATINVDLEAGPFVRIIGEDVSISVLDQTFSS